jgi:hypothetical protein
MVVDPGRLIMARGRIGLGAAIPLLIVGLICTPLNVYFSFLDKPFTNGVITTATVTDVSVTETRRHNRRSFDYGRIITFQTRDGRTITVEPDQTTELVAPRIGEQVKVSYRPQNPSRARILVSPGALTTWGYHGCTLIGALMMLAGLNGIVRRFDRRANP